jgi:hypothetical protein
VEDGHDIFYAGDENPTVHISVIKPVKKDGSLSTSAELEQYASPKEYRVKREDLQYTGGDFTINFYENNPTAENGKTLQSIQCSAVSNGYLLYATIVADEMKCCEKAVQYIKTLTQKKR